MSPARSDRPSPSLPPRLRVLRRGAAGTAPRLPPPRPPGSKVVRRAGEVHPAPVRIEVTASRRICSRWTAQVPAGFQRSKSGPKPPPERAPWRSATKHRVRGTRQLKDVYAIVDRGGSARCRPLKGPRFAERCRLQQGHAYVAEPPHHAAKTGIESRLDSPPEPRSWSEGLDRRNSPATSGNSSRSARRQAVLHSADGNIVMPAYFQAGISRVDPKTGINRELRPGRCATRSASTGIHRPGSCGHESMDATGWADESPNDTLHVATRKGRISVSLWRTRAIRFDPEFGKKPLLVLRRSRRGVEARGARSRHRHALLRRQTMFPAESRTTSQIAMRGFVNSHHTAKELRRHRGDFSMRTASRGAMEPYPDGFLVDEKGDPPCGAVPTT